MCISSFTRASGTGDIFEIRGQQQKKNGWGKVTRVYVRVLFLLLEPNLADGIGSPFQQGQQQQQLPPRLG